MHRLFISLMLFIVIPGCGTAKDDLSVKKANQANPSAFSEIPSQVGSIEEAKMTEPFPYWSASALNSIPIKSELKADILEGLFNFQPSLMHAPGDNVRIGMSALPENTYVILSLEEFHFKEKSFSLVGEKKVTSHHDMSMKLPKKENKVYRFSMRLFDAKTKKLLDELQYRIYVPYQNVVNAKLEADKKVVNKGEIVTITLTNWGPTTLTTGSGYMIEKWNNGNWEPIDLELAFHDSLMLIRPHNSISFKIDTSVLSKGKYRIIKGMGLETSYHNETLAIILTVH
jgi:hypothetical protein